MIAFLTAIAVTLGVIVSVHFMYVFRLEKSEETET